MSWRPYESYQRTPLDWLPSIPAHWKVQKLGGRGDFIGGTGFPHELQGETDKDIPFYKVSDTNLPGNEVYLSESANAVDFETVSILGARVCPSGTIVFPKVGATLLQNKRRLLTKPSVFDNNMMGFLPRRGVAKYWYYWLSELDFRQLANPGAVPSINESQLRMMPGLCPPLAEQYTIAAFLDHETARIDRLVEKQQRLIELLEEKRQAVISHAVTKGLDPDAPMKDSGVEWLGEVPAHWEVARVKWVAKLESGHTPSKSHDEYWQECDIPWVSLNDSKTLASHDYIDSTKYNINALGLANSSARLLPKGAVVFTRDATIGLAAITTKPMAVSQHLIAWVCNTQRIIPEYLLLAFYAMAEALERYTFGATIRTIGMPDVRRLVTPVPPVDEQRQIVAHAFGRKNLIDQTINRARRAVKLLTEHRAALISAAVTGQIDVRGWQPTVDEPAPPLLQAAEEPATYG